MAYTVTFKPSALKSLRKLDDDTRERILRTVIRLETNPYQTPGAQKLQGREGFRLRVGTYRVLYEVHQSRLLVLVVEVGHRREVYRRR